MGKILMVEDDPGIMEVSKIILEKAGHTFIGLREGETILQTVAIEKPDLILLDLMLPGVNGSEIATKLKKNPESKEIPVVVVSARYNIKQIAEEIGSDGYLSKPFEIEDLTDLAEKYLQKA
ncbi:PleD family two-component system response regulator [Roseivirga sp. BDSF3-8]|uniref:response regulator n=1 Tax=Roseivirga sp. BDSF3-8 TaxID=3241598 RepID=UPI003531CE1A